MGMSNAAVAIRTDLKAAGYALRAFSIRSSRTGSVTVEIKDPSIAKRRITEIACAHQHIDRDRATGEILGGGNTFVSVRYSHEALEAAAGELTARLRAGERSFGSLHVDGEGPDAKHTWHVWTTGDLGRHLRQISPFGGEALAELLADRGVLAAVLAPAPAAAAPDRAELDERRTHAAIALDLLRRAVRELEGCGQLGTVRETDQALNEAEASIKLALRELDS